MSNQERAQPYVSQIHPRLYSRLSQLQSHLPPSQASSSPQIEATNSPLSLRLGSVAPNFKAETNRGPIDFHEFIGDSWVVLFSHPDDFTPVCTTELGAFAKLEPEFKKRNVKLIGLSANTIDQHDKWIKDIDEISGSKLSFPIIGDKSREIAYKYDMLDHQDLSNVDEKGIAFTIRSVFIIDPAKKMYVLPAAT